ncbi:MAG TPA: amidohydrolase [Gemmatimonadaceae bacterium]|jgi:aminobenzoyl-glutamate utilization protein B|nr:amidohydrolase [Gemmatimonadaceae bacterium]
MRIRSFAAALVFALPVAAQQPADARLAALKQEVADDIDRRAPFTQQMVDQIFSFGELGFQEVETSKYLVAMLRANGFTVQENFAGIPTAWLATWGSGKPVIALGADLDDIPQASQRPGVACHEPLVAGAPGHGEGHNAGQAVNITAILAVKKVMERDHIKGTIKVWPGIAEEQLGSKAYFVRAGMFKDVDVVLFSHVDAHFGTGWGQEEGSGLVSVLYAFGGQAAHAAGAPWRGRSALDAVELMDAGWNFRREHLRLQQRSHYVIVNGGDQPNVVPPTASVWYYFRELDYDKIKALWAIGDSMALGATIMTGTQLTSERVLGSAWPGHYNKPIAEALTANIKTVGMPKWTDADVKLAKAVQKELKQKEDGLDTAVEKMTTPVPDSANPGGGSDDIGDVSWNVPTVTLRYPANIPNLPGHHWSDAIAMATPLAHKGTTAGAKAQAMTMLDIFLTPALVDSAWSYFKNVQTKDVKYQPLMRPEDRPATELNAGIMAKYRPLMQPFYFDSKKYKTYLEQLGVAYPTVRAADGSCGKGTATP